MLRLINRQHSVFHLLALVVSIIATVFVNVCVDASPIIVDHGNFDDILSYDQETLDKIGDLKIFFSHASVGNNMMSGMTLLHSSDTNRYQLNRVSVGATPPASTVDGTVYDYQRGNPGWSAKFANFQTYVNNGWRADKVDIAMDKLCYIDQSANVNTYLNMMTGLEAAYPTTDFVYMTMPLKTSTDSSERLRHTYNEAVRDFVIANDKILLDIADIEAWSPQGVEQTFSYGGQDYQRMYSGYTSDGGHLISAGYTRVAQGMYSLFGMLVEPNPVPGDTNGDFLVNLLDLVTLGEHYNQDCDLLATCGDFTGNGHVDLLDLVILGENWTGDNMVASESAIPEPSAVVILTGASIVLIRRRTM